MLIARRLTKAHDGRPTVRGVDLALRRGEVVGLLGPNGAGKTTTFSMIAGMQVPDSGVVMLDDKNITRLPLFMRARMGLGYLPQEASIFRGSSVEDNILIVLESLIADRKALRARLDGLLEEFGITHVRRSKAGALSGGERRRLEIARTLASDPSFILLDEPFAGVDPIAVTEVRILVRKLSARGIGVLVTDHNVRETLSLVDRAYILDGGLILASGSVEHIVADPRVKAVYLGADFVL
ncbi:LPS export ABC transporter ATP-binding protein [Phreatobacter cathodiphilus]|uniref:Lipopolysaccharide export system ATP-binding protein LptB n=1 Tax=Phreatobacter cathodiphilus TaxID=1868589 RepID=A0A2S0N6I4_9HYPH|nr:LPS export ABC transporter ATP-binding protein [Phreatobacter cathodiphilus]AVO43769.1 LPS export ABC transporter ATP-binding protein [Phreatobacter cathodiphilus]